MTRHPRPRRRTFAEWVAGSRKAVAALSGTVSMAIAQGVLPEPYGHYSAGVLAAATVGLTYLVENDDTHAPPGPRDKPAPRHADHPED